MIHSSKMTHWLASLQANKMPHGSNDNATTAALLVKEFAVLWR
jgi:hypothetical protein